MVPSFREEVRRTQGHRQSEKESPTNDERYAPASRCSKLPRQRLSTRQRNPLRADGVRPRGHAFRKFGRARSKIRRTGVQGWTSLMPVPVKAKTGKHGPRAGD